MTSVARQQAKADAMPRYAEPTWDELREADFDEVLTCEDCNWYIRCGKADAHAVVRKLGLYSKAGGSERLQAEIRQAVQRCGICARRTELRAGDDTICDDGFEERS